MEAIAYKKAAAEQEKAAAKQECQLALQEMEQLDQALALSVAVEEEKNEEAANEAEAAAHQCRWDCEQIEQQKACKTKQEEADAEVAYKLAKAEGGLDEHAKVAAEYAAKNEVRSKREREEASMEKYSKKLRRVLADVSDADRVSTCCTIMQRLLDELRPSERVLVAATMAQAVLSHQEIAAMTVAKLKEALKVRGLDQKGVKAALAARLQAAMLGACAHEASH